MLTVRYALTRVEVWRWYWKAWRRGLWMAHAFIAFSIILAFTVNGVGGSVAASIVLGLLTGLAVCAAMVGYPQLRYSPQERALTANEEGLSFVRGRQSGRMQWKKIRSVQQDNRDVVVSGRSGSAFIIPNRAFDSAEEVTAFAVFAQSRIKA